MLAEIVYISCLLSVRQHHDNHIAAFFQGHSLIVALWVAKSLRESAQVVNRIFVRVVAALLVLEKWCQGVFDEIWVKIQHDWPGREDHVNGLDIAVGADLFKEYSDVIRSACILEGSKCLSDGKTGNGEIIVSTSRDRVLRNTIVEISGILAGVAVVFVEEWNKFGFIKVACPE